MNGGNPILRTTVLRVDKAADELRRQALQQIKKLRQLSDKKALVPFTGNINCGGALGGALNLLALSDFIDLGVEALQTDQNFFDLIDAQASREKEDFRAQGVHTTVGYFLGVRSSLKTNRYEGTSHASPVVRRGQRVRRYAPGHA